MLYSYRKASTGFRVAARQLCHVTVSKAIFSMNMPASIKIYQLNVVLRAKFSSHLFIAWYALGVAITKATTIHFTKPLFSLVSISDFLALFTLRIEMKHQILFWHEEFTYTPSFF